MDLFKIPELYVKYIPRIFLKKHLKPQPHIIWLFITSSINLCKHLLSGDRNKIKFHILPIKREWCFFSNSTIKLHKAEIM